MNLSNIWDKFVLQCFAALDPKEVVKGLDHERLLIKYGKVKWTCT